MIAKTASTISNYVHVRFEVPAGVEATQIALVGDFNQWNAQSHPLHREMDGAWQLELDLPQGQRYQFRYIADGQWWTDYCADGCERGPFGGENSIVDTRLLYCKGDCLLEFYKLTRLKE